MAINLASKFSGKIAEKFTKESYVQGNTSNEYDFVGVKTVSIYTPVTVDLSNYDRSAAADRFGKSIEMQDTVQELTLTQEPSFSITIDRGNNADQMNIKPAVKMLGLQVREKMVPFNDRYCFAQWSKNAGTKIEIAAEPTKDTIVKDIFGAAAAMDNDLVPDNDRVIYLPTKYYNMLRQAPEFLAVDKLAIKALSKGVVGMVADMVCVKVPDVYMPEKVYFLCTYKRSVMNPTKIKTARVLTDVKGIDGAVLEGRHYLDAFVIGAKSGGVVAAVAADTVPDAPAVSISSHSATVTAVSGITFYVSKDGNDPRYDKNAVVYSGAVTTVSGQKIAVAGKNADGWWGAVSYAADNG